MIEAEKDADMDVGEEEGADEVMVDADPIGELEGQEPVKSAGHVVEEREDQQPFPIESSVSLSVEFSGILRAHANCVFFCMHTLYSRLFATACI